MSISEQEIYDIIIRPLGLGHINEIVEIEDLVFASPWSKQSFIYELVHNDVAYYLVALNCDKVVGYGGMWLILDEAHITNIAVHPKYQGSGIGERILKKLIALSDSLGADKMTLEVRPSNEKAKSLYSKLGFICKGSRKGYYTDTNEDAIIMWLEDLKNKRGSLD